MFVPHRRLKPMAWGMFLGLSLSLGACSSHKPKADVVDVPAPTPAPASDAAAANGADKTQHAATQIESSEELDEGQRAIRAQWLTKWVKYYTRNDKSRFQRHLDRAEPYRWVVEKIFEENGVPGDLFYLGVIESGFQNHAKSRASAVGIWQFIKGTADRYGLAVNRYVDERRDPIRATVAAAKYLKDLYNVFHSWPLAMAAYNAGEGRVLHAVMRGKTRNFWELCDKGMLPDETANYVPKILSAMIISKNRARYGLREAPEYSYPMLKLVDVPSSVSLFTLARASGAPVNELKMYNPQLIREMTPPNGLRHKIWVTDESFEAVQRAALNVKGNKALQYASFKPSEEEVNALPGMNRVDDKNDDAPAAPVVVAKKADKVPDDDDLLSNDGDDVIPTANVASERKPANARVRRLTIASNARKNHASAKVSTHMIFVKKGENMFEIAQRFSMTPAELKKLNKLKSSQLVVGQSLKVPSSTFKPKKTVQYRVKPGDNLHRIARKFGKSVDELRAMNSLKRENVFAGEVIKVDANGI